MLDSIFDINKFNIISDADNYYFFRALEDGDIADINNKINVDKEGNIIKLRTDRERFGSSAKYKADDVISLREMYEHIKIHYSQDTNCISLTSNACVALMYGNDWFDDKYIIIKVPHQEMNEKYTNAPLYMMKEINKEISNLVKNNELDANIISLLEQIDKVKSTAELDNIMNSTIVIADAEAKIVDIIYGNYKTINYNALNEEQNLEKNKLISKLKLIKKNILPGVSNNFLIQTIGSAFSSLEITKYQDLEADIKTISKEYITIFALLQQLPAHYENLFELKEEIINYVYNNKETFVSNLDNFPFNPLSIAELYKLTEGKVTYEKASSLYKKLFYFAKAKLRARETVKLIKNITNNNPKYANLYDLLARNTYGIETEIMSRMSTKVNKISESVSFDIKQNERKLLQFVNRLVNEDLEYIVNRPVEALKYYLDSFDYDSKLDIDEYYADAVISAFDFRKIGLEKLYPEHRELLLKKLRASNIVDTYNYYENLYGKDVNLDMVLTSIIKGKRDISPNELFTISAFDEFLGFNKETGQTLNLYEYQKPVAASIHEEISEKNYTSAILPTGVGKSYIALYELYRHRNEKLLYIAPNVEILNQLKRIIVECFQPDQSSRKDPDQLFKEIFPNLTLATYQDLRDSIKEEEIFQKTGKKVRLLKSTYQTCYDFIVCDELHRTGAAGWQEYMEMLFTSRSASTKILGLTATPERDRDNKDMSEYWAKFFGYTDEEILKGLHRAYSMDFLEAIEKGIIANPRVVNCMYSFVNDGTLEQLGLDIENMSDEGLKADYKRKYEQMRKNITNANGIEKILNDTLNPNSKMIVFLPVTKKNDGSYENEFGERVDKSTAERTIKDYQTLMRQYLYGYNYLEEKSFIKVLYQKIMTNGFITEEEARSLEQEKENLLLLSKIDIKYKPQALNVDTNIIADTIIEYMDWQHLSKHDLVKQLKVKTKDLMESYSMLGSYSAKKNRDNLLEFSKPNNGKMKLMFVMNKLNEGVHVAGVNGIIWLRPLDSDSTVLCSQHIGRTIRGIAEGEEIKESDRPIIIDLVNNLWKVNLNKNKNQEQIDLYELNNIIYCIEYYKKFPEVNSSDYKTLRRIKNKYEKYTDSQLLAGIKLKKRQIIAEIINCGAKIDLWSTNFVKSANGASKTKGDNSGLLGLFGVKGIYRDFVDLYDEVNNYASADEKIMEYLEAMKANNNRLISSTSNLKFSNGESMSYFWRNNRQRIYNYVCSHEEELIGYEECIKIIKEEYKKYIQKKANEISNDERNMEYLKAMKANNNRFITRRFKLKFSNGTSMSSFWTDNRQKLYDYVCSHEEELIGYDECIKVIKEEYNKYLQKRANEMSDDERNMEYLKAIKENNNQLILSTSSLKFSNGESMSKFWYRNRQKLYDYVCSHEEELVGYKECIKTIKEGYKKYFYKKANEISKSERNMEYLKAMKANNNQLIPSTSSLKFSNGTYMSDFWYNNRQKLYDYVCRHEEELMEYEECIKTIKEEYMKYLQIKADEKIMEYLKAIKENNNHLISHSSKLKFSDGVSMAYFWINNRQKLYDYVCRHEEELVGYEGCIKVIKEGYKKYLHKKANEISEDERNMEYLEAMKENNNRLIPSTSSLKFSNGTSMSSFWNSNRKKLYDYVCSHEEELMGYEECIKTIKEEYNKYSCKKANEISEDERNMEYLEAMKENNNQLISHSSKSNFSNGTSMSQFWNVNRKKIYNYVCSHEEELVGYEECIKIIKEEYKKYIQKKANEISNDERNMEYLKAMKANNNRFITRRFKLKFSNGTSMSSFWTDNRQKLYDYVCSHEEELIGYDECIKVIKEEYNKYLQKRANEMSDDERNMEYLKAIKENNNQLILSTSRLKFSNG